MHCALHRTLVAVPSVDCATSMEAPWTAARVCQGGRRMSTPTEDYLPDPSGATPPSSGSSDAAPRVRKSRWRRRLRWLLWAAIALVAALALLYLAVLSYRFAQVQLGPFAPLAVAFVAAL